MPPVSGARGDPSRVSKTLESQFAVSGGRGSAKSHAGLWGASCSLPLPGKVARLPGSCLRFQPGPAELLRRTGLGCAAMPLTAMGWGRQATVASAPGKTQGPVRKSGRLEQGPHSAGGAGPSPYQPMDLVVAAEGSCGKFASPCRCWQRHSDCSISPILWSW